LILLYLYDGAEKVKLVRPMFLDDRPHGVSASRHPCRPDGIGLSVVRLMKRDKNVLEVAGIDVLDGMPLLDIKTYIPKFDSFPKARGLDQLEEMEVESFRGEPRTFYSSRLCNIIPHSFFEGLCYCNFSCFPKRCGIKSGIAPASSLRDSAETGRIISR